jgi:AcrR family transcriptional regulator
MRIAMGETPNAEPARAGRPRDARLDAAIVAATLELLDERGYNELSLTAVADQADTTTAAIYRRWSSKSELVAKAVFRTDGDDVVADTDDIAADLATMIRWSVDKLARPAALAAIAGLLGEGRADRRARVADAAIAVDLTVERLRRAQAAGQLRPDVDATVLAALIDGPVMHAALSGTASQIDERWISDLVAVVLDGARSRPAADVDRHRTPSRTRTDTSEVTAR